MISLDILIAEDNAGDVMLVREALAEHGINYELHVVADGQQAIDFIAQIGDSVACPNLLLLDLNLAKGDGRAVLEAFRKHPECAATPVIVMSSSEMPRDRQWAVEAKITRYFRKPSDLDAFMELGAIVKDVMRESGVLKGDGHGNT